VNEFNNYSIVALIMTKFKSNFSETPLPITDTLDYESIGEIQRQSIRQKTFDYG